jgi:hypothetical protein
MLSEAVDHFYASRIALEILLRIDEIEPRQYKT